MGSVNVAASEAVASTADSVLASGRMARARKPRARSERSLIRGAQAGSEADLELLFRAHWPRAYRAAFLIVHDHAAAEDIAQEAFLRAVRNLDRFDRRRPFAPWLGAIVANRSIDWARARNARRETGCEPPDCSAPPEQPRGYSDEVVVALASLTPEHRAVVVMRYVLEYTPGEIARALELPRGTVNSRLRRGLDALKAALREEGGR
jgi:RNA polymerase sigma-70 factor, ECF subfamily